MIDTLKIFEDLKSANLSEPRARAIAQPIDASFEANQLQQVNLLAEKVDASKFASEMPKIEPTIKEMELRLRTDLARLETKLETKMADGKSELLHWMFAFWIGQVGATIAVIFSAIKLLK